MPEKGLKNKTKRGLFWSFLNQFANEGIQFVIGIFMARLLSPSDYGITALPAVFMAVAGVFVGGGFSDALVRKTEIKEEDLSTAFYYSIGVGIVCYTILFLASPLIAEFYNTPVLENLMKVTALSFLYGPLNTPQNVILKRRLDFKTPAKVSVVCRIFAGVIGISLAFCGYGVWALVLSSLFSGILGLLINWYIVRWFPKTGWSKESFRYLWGYGNKMMASSLLDTLYMNITPVFIGKYYSTGDLGVYNKARNYAKLPSVHITQTIQSVSFPVISKIKDDNEKLEVIYRRMIRLSGFVIFPLMMMLAALARPLIIVMITEKWASSIYLLQIICFARMWYPIHALNLSLLRAKGRSDLFFKLEIYKKAMGLTILSITLPLGLVIFCYGEIISSLLGLFINTYYTGKLINCGYIKQMKDLLPTLIISFMMFLIVYGLTLVIPNLFLQIIIGGITGSVFYLICAKLFRSSELKDLLYILNRKG
ncbi:MAG: lipopolysaccharide biosynthesis protein [Prevotella sp.]|nr:lipopolysaccharide biosynthesis protein [Prevotella sp.]